MPEISFCKNTMSWQNIFILMADYKLSSSFSKNRKNNSQKTPQFILFILTHFHQKINYFIPLKESCCLHILLFPFPYLSPIFILQLHDNPYFTRLKKKIIPKKNKKRRGHFLTIRKIITKRPDVCVNTLCSKTPWNLHKHWI